MRLFQKKAFQAAALILLLVIVPGCTSFNTEWKKAAALPATDGMTGRWEGRWLSDVNGHNGRLRCVVTKQEDGTYQARFHAKYQSVLSFGYTVPLKAERTNDTYTFNGEADLGWLAGGIYHYAGHTDPT